MRNQLKTIYSALLVVATLGVTTSVHGVPAFARQTGLDCNSCHSASGYPALNSFGQAFKAGGYTQGNEDEMLGDGEALSLPKVMHMSLVFKGRLPIEGDDAGNTTMTSEIPDELAILAGGKIGKNIGWLTEIGSTAAEFASFKVVFAPELGPVRLGIVPWFSDLSPAYFFETQSTGAVRNLRTWEDRGVSSALNAVDFGGANAGMNSGLGIYLWHTMGYFAFTPFVDDHKQDWLGDTTDIGYYVRGAFTPTVGNMELGAGVQYYGGRTAGANLNTIAADVQAVIGLDTPIIATVTYANDIENTASALAITAEVAIVPDSFNVGAAFRLGLTDSITHRIGLLAKLNIVRNARLQLDAHFDLEDNSWQVMPMLFGSF